MKRSSCTIGTNAKRATLTRQSKRLQSLHEAIKVEQVPGLQNHSTKNHSVNNNDEFSSRQVKIESNTDQIAYTTDSSSFGEVDQRDEPRIKVEFEQVLKSENTPSVPPNVFPQYTKDLETKQPSNWIGIYNEIVRMRALIETPVDRMGCGTMPVSLTQNPDVSHGRIYRFQLLVALMLSSQTKDEVNFAAMTTLHQHCRDQGYNGLCLEAIVALSEAKIDECISKVGFHRRKAIYLKKASAILQEKFDSDIPNTIEDVVSLPGVGPKMGHLLLQNGWGINMGIGVDVHLHRLAQMWGWVPESDNPEVTRMKLEEWLPRECWSDINPLLVGFGQTVCPVKANNCDICTLADGLCKKANKTLARTELTKKRIAKLSENRGDLSGLIALRIQRDTLRSHDTSEPS